MTESGRETPSKLRWRCRRGMRELDVLLSGWLDERWPDASDEMRGQFERLLDCEDDRIWGWLSGRSEPAAELAAIVGDIIQQARGHGRG